MKRFAGKHFWALFGSVWLFVGVIFLAVASSAGLQQYRLKTVVAAKGKVAQGKVLSKYMDKEVTPPRFEVSYRFAAPDGQTRYGSSKVPAAVWDRLLELEPLQVTYLADDPDYNFAEGADLDSMLVWIFGSLGGVLSIPGGVIVAKILAGPRGSKNKYDDAPANV
jgi:hypothetical protein